MPVVEVRIFVFVLLRWMPYWGPRAVNVRMNQGRSWYARQALVSSMIEPVEASEPCVSSFGPWPVRLRCCARRLRSWLMGLSS